SDWGVMEMVRERPIAAAAAAASAAAAGLFLWSKRTQISDQLNHLFAPFADWRERSGSDFDDTAGLTNTSSSSRRGMSETGGGNASLGRSSGGAGAHGRPRRRGGGSSAPPHLHS